MRKQYLTAGLCFGLILHTIPSFIHLITGGEDNRHFIVAYLIGCMGVVLGFVVRGTAEECIRDAEKRGEP